MTQLRDKAIYVVVCEAFFQRVMLLQDMYKHPYREETYLIEGEWEEGEHAFFQECRLKVVDKDTDGKASFLFEYKNKSPIEA